MKLEEVRRMAKLQSISAGKLSKSELIKSMQRNEGNFDCFATAYEGVCNQTRCSWRNDCFEASRQGALS